MQKIAILQRTLLVSPLCIWSGMAMASGDPLAALEALMAALLHIAGGGFILSYAKLKRVGFRVAAIYLAPLTVSFIWVFFNPLFGSLIELFFALFFPVSVSLFFWARIRKR